MATFLALVPSLFGRHVHAKRARCTVRIGVLLDDRQVEQEDVAQHVTAAADMTVEEGKQYYNTVVTNGIEMCSLHRRPFNE